MNDVSVPHFAFPLTISGAGVAVVNEQDSSDDVADCVAVLVGTIQGEREEVPDYGIPDQTFGQEVDINGLAAAVEEWEPRADVTFDVQISSADQLVKMIKTTVEVHDG